MPKLSTTTTPSTLAEHNAVQKALAADPRAMLIYRDGGQMRRLDTGEAIAIADVTAAAVELLAQKRRVLVRYEPTVILPGGCPLPPAWPPPSDWWDDVVVADSGGKDSRYLTDMTVREYGPERVTLICNLLGNEHRRAPYEVAEMARHYGVRLFYTWKDRDGRSCWGTVVPESIQALYAHDFGGEADTSDIIDQDDQVVRLAEGRGQWPSANAPLCTSSLKRDTSNVVLRALPEPANADPGAADQVVRLAERRGQWPGPAAQTCTDRLKSKTTDVMLRANDLPAALRRGKRRVLRTGERGAESPSRVKKPTWQTRIATRANLVLWERPLIHVTNDELWAYLIQYQVPVPASYWGLSRFSCVNCIYKPWHEHCLVGLLYPRPLARRVAAELRMGHVVSLGLRYGEYVGYQAVWGFLYGPFIDKDTLPPPRPEAVATILGWWRSGVYHRPPEGVIMLGESEVPAGFDIADLPPVAGGTRPAIRLPCGG